MARGWFKREKKEKKEETLPQKVEITDLERVCGKDKKVCKALQHTMFLDPRKIGATSKDAAKKAADFEKKGENERARIWYHIAGGLALWKGDTTKLKQHFSKCAKLTPEMGYELITKVPEKATANAKKYYAKYLK